MRPNDELAVIDWLAGLFPLVPRRGTRLAFMFTDLEGFTAHAALQGNGAALRLLRRHDALVLPAIRTHDGALRAAIAIQAAAARRRPTVKLRIGIHAGEVRCREGDLVGHDLNVAARVTERARGGRIVVSDALRIEADGVPVRFRRTRPLLIPGREPLPLFSVERKEGTS
ncbi:MAG: adenylate/guanylate cyclase domain-containing protein [Deltaproteobacteria bacterium]|nr:MAG: adenylate/guanylate cyclase domain-containing protein [Deltaproteobacteria bacterium]